MDNHSTVKSLRAWIRGISRRAKGPTLLIPTASVQPKELADHEPAISETSLQPTTCSTFESISIPQVQQALTVARKGEYELRDDHPVPEIEADNEVMIRNYAVGLNPIDWKSVDYDFCLPSFPWVCIPSAYALSC